MRKRVWNLDPPQPGDPPPRPRRVPPRDPTIWDAVRQVVRHPIVVRSVLWGVLLVLFCTGIYWMGMQEGAPPEVSAVVKRVQIQQQRIQRAFERKAPANQRLNG